MKRRGPNRIWKKEDIELIEAVKQHKHLYDAPFSELNKVAYKRLCSKSWDEISSKLGMPAMELRKKWIFIKSYYKKAFIIKNYTGKFLDGTLDFLKPWASNIHSNYEEMEISNISSTEEDNVSDSEATINLPLETITCLNKEGSSERHIETIDPLAPCSSQYAVNFEEQVLSNVNSDVANANDQRKVWTQEDMIFIEAIKPHKSLYTVPTRTSDRVLNKKQSAMAWKVVASQLGMPVMELRHKWRAIKNNYKEAIMKEDSSKLLDGTLDFLKPWASHYIMNSNDETTDDEALDSFSILPTEEDSVMYVDSSDSDNEATITPPLENNHIIDESSENDTGTTDILRSCSGQYAINYEEQILPDVNNDVENANDHSILRNILIQKRWEICEESQNHEETSHSDLLSDFFARYDGTTHDSNLMEYFRDLAEVLCIKLAPAKRQNFIRQIDFIVSQILTENKNDNEDIEELE
ncbi:hypothetical protein B5X24_HaOG216668 [Helicoverpa armigera]|nr:hypothetical protein B5X24_HaOG216668 [Helicoverpa armigera]